jgi:sirohydrochlorin ferrochelatase
MTPRHLLIVAHGSRRQASNSEVMHLDAQVRTNLGKGIDDVSVAFLELAAPSIPEGLAGCVARGAGEIVVVPYFLAAGTHVANDLPEAIGNFQAEHPNIKVRLAHHLGASPLLPRIILDIADSAPGS